MKILAGYFLFWHFIFFFEIKKSVSKTPNNKDILNIILFSLMSACALYARQALVFLPISYLLYLFFNNANKKIIIISIISFVIFAIPGFLLMWIWGGVYPTLPAGQAPHGGFIGGWIQPIHVLKNIPILLGFFWILFIANFL